MTLRRPERHWRTAALVLLALLAGWYFAVCHGSGAGVTPGSVLAAALLVAAWRVHHGRLVCVRAIQRTGKTGRPARHPRILADPSRSSYDEVHRMMWTLTELRPAATNE